MEKREKRPAMVNWFGITDEQFWSMVEPEEHPCDCRLWLGKWGRGGYGVIHLGRYGVLVPGKSIWQSTVYPVAFRWSPYYSQRRGKDISHLCGLSACCNPLHLLPLDKGQNTRDAVTHRNMLNGFSVEERQDLRASGMGFKEIARTLDIPGGVAFRILYDRIERDRYPAPFIDDKALTRQAKEWYEATHNFELSRGADAYTKAPRPKVDTNTDDLFVFPALPRGSQWLNPWEEE